VQEDRRRARASKRLALPARPVEPRPRPLNEPRPLLLGHPPKDRDEERAHRAAGVEPALADGKNREIKPPDFIVKPFFPRGELIEIVGAHGAFKSTIALDACLCVATGRSWAGVPTVQGRTAFITLEDSTDTLARRLKAWLEGVHQNAAFGRAASEEAAAERGVRENFTFLARERSQGLVLTKTEEGGH
jgi:hypothetical protein